MAVYRSSIRDARDYSGPLLGFEIEAYALSSVTGDDGFGEDEASGKTLRRVARHLRHTTGLPFIPLIEDDWDAERRKTKAPNSSLANPVWAVTSDYSLEPFCFRNEYVIGIELVTPPLSPRLALKCLAMLHAGVFPKSGRGHFLADSNAGLHINVSVPNISHETAGVAILNPFASSVPSYRRERFADTLFTAVVGILSRGANSPEEAIDAFVKLAAKERGCHPTNPGPLLKRRGYVEFRHLGSMVFRKSLDVVEDFCWKALHLLSDPPMADVRQRAEQALKVAKRVRCLDTGDRLGSALSLINDTEKRVFSFCENNLENCGFFNAVFEICLSDSLLCKVFPWVRYYDTYRKSPTTFDRKMARKLPSQSSYLMSYDNDASDRSSALKSNGHAC